MKPQAMVFVMMLSSGCVSLLIPSVNYIHSHPTTPFILDPLPRFRGDTGTQLLQVR